MIKVRIIADSINPAGQRITTFEKTYPRMVHSEEMTHRVLVKNAASSRAIPVEQMIRAVRENPALFYQYGKKNKGMTAQELMDPETQAAFIKDWKWLCGEACDFADRWQDDAAKQLVNRAMEPWMHMTILETGTEWHNYFALRAHPAADPTFQVMAYRTLDCYLKGTPVERNFGEWHLPMVPEEERLADYRPDLPAISSGRCCRVSYVKHDAESTPTKDYDRGMKCVTDGHMSPTEHPALATKATTGCGAYNGWIPWRKMLPNENRTNVDLHALLANKPDWISLDDE